MSVLDRIELAHDYSRMGRHGMEHVRGYESRHPMDAEGGYRRRVRVGDQVRAIDFRSSFAGKVGTVTHIHPHGHTLRAQFGDNPQNSEGTGTQWFRRVPSDAEQAHYQASMEGFDKQSKDAGEDAYRQEMQTARAPQSLGSKPTTGLPGVTQGRVKKDAGEDQYVAEMQSGGRGKYSSSGVVPSPDEDALRKVIERGRSLDRISTPAGRAAERRGGR